MITRRRQDVLEENETVMIASSPVKTETITAVTDISKGGEVAASFSTISAKSRSRDILIHNAAYFGSSNPLMNDTVDEWFQSLETNARGSFLAARVFWSRVVPDATMVNIAGTTVHRHGSNFPGASAYTASKIAVMRLFDYLQVENPELHFFNLPPAWLVNDLMRKVGMTTAIDTGMSHWISLILFCHSLVC